jgi:O-antigen ligase
MKSVHKWSGLIGWEAAQTNSDVAPAGETCGAAGEWTIVILVLANLWWTTLCLGGYRPETMVVAGAVNFATFGLWWAFAAWRRRWLELPGAAIATLPFLVYGAMNAAWITPVPWLGWRDWLGWAQMVAVFCVVLAGVRTGRARMALFAGVVVLGALAVGMAVYQQLKDPGWLMMGRRQALQFLGRSSGPFGIPNSLAAFLNLLLPATVALTFQRGAGALQRVVCGYLTALFACGVLLTFSRGAWLSLGVALTAWPLLAVHGSARRWRWSLLVALLLVASVAALYLNSSEVRERADQLLRNQGEVSRAVMWRAGWKLAGEHPLFGTGAGSYSVLFEKHRPARFWDDPHWAHNDYLNTLSDYGIVGFLLSFGIAASMLAGRGRRLFQRGRRTGEIGRMPALRAGLAIGLLAFALQLFVDFNLKIPALAQVAAIAAALVMAPSAGRILRGWERSVRMPWIVGALGVVLLAAGIPRWIVPIYRAEALRYEAREQLERLIRHPPAENEELRSIAATRDRLVQAVRIDPRNGYAWSDLADAWLAEARFEPGNPGALGAKAEAAATQALACSRAVPEFWVRRARAFDLQNLWRDAWADFVEALTLAPRRSDLWYSYAFHLSLRDLDSARAALATCLELDPWNSPALTLQKRLGNSHR